MAGVHFHDVTIEISTTTALKTLWQLAAAANVRVLLHAFTISFKGVAPTDAPIRVDILRQTTAGSGGTSQAHTKHNPGDAETIQCTSLYGITTEPTAGDVLESFYVHPQGRREFVARYEKQKQIPGGTRLGVRVLAGVAVNAIFSGDLEE